MADNMITVFNASETLLGATGNDLILGQFGNDTLNGGARDDTMSGGAGNDLCVWGSGGGNDTITVTGINGAGFDATDFIL